MLRYVDIKNRILRHLDEAATAAVTNTTDALVEDAINASHRRLCLARSYAFMKWPREETVSSTAGVRAMTLSPHVGKLTYLWSVTDQRYVPMLPHRQWESQSVNRTVTADSSAGIFGGFWPVMSQPTSASQVTVVSTNAGDTVSRQIAVRGVNASGDIISETITATGTTPVTSSTSFVAILNVTKLGTWAGTMTLAISGGATLLTLLASEYAKQYPTIEFVEIPASAKSFSYSFTRIPRTLTEDNDIPEIPFPFSEAIVFDALLEIGTYRTDLNATHLSMWGQRQAAIVKELNEAQDESIIASVPRTVRDLDWEYTRILRLP
jgi:hypothetical protein